MIITDQDEIMSIAKNRWRDNPQKGGFALDWDKVCFHNTIDSRKILIMTESDISLSDAVDILFEEIKSLGPVETRTIILGTSEKTPSLTCNNFSTAGSPYRNCSRKAQTCYLRTYGPIRLKQSLFCS